MKKRLCTLTSFMLVVGMAVAVAGCGLDAPTDSRAERILDTTAVHVWQDASGGVLMELKDFSHEGFAWVSDSGQSATSMDFSLDGGTSWRRGEPISDFFNEMQRGIYEITVWDNGSFSFQPDHPFGTPAASFAAGEQISITFRIPESDTYKASKWSEPRTYTLKAPCEDDDAGFADHYGSSLEDKSYYDNFQPSSIESNGFVIYKEENFLKFGKLTSTPSGAGEYTHTFTALEDLSDADKDEIAKYEYKFVSKQEYALKGSEHSILDDTSFTPSVWYEDYGMMHGLWQNIPMDGIVFNGSKNLVWEHTQTDSSGMGTTVWNKTSFVLLVRLKETENTAMSRVRTLSYILSESEEA